MRPIVIALICATSLTISSTGFAQPRSATLTQATPRAVAEGLLAADRNFSIESGHTEGLGAFDRMFADDVIMFAAPMAGVLPVAGFARGRAAAVERLAQALRGNSGRTEWTPIRVGISADGQHGFTFGYTVTRRDGQAPSHGKYVSYWVRGPQGWRVAFYKRVPRLEGEVSSTLMPPALPSRLIAVSPDAASVAAIRTSLDRREREFSDNAVRRGLGPAFVAFGSADAVNVGGGAQFTVGNVAIGEMQGDGPSPLTWAPDGVTVASSGDLGVTWGMLHRTGPTPPGRLAEIPFFTIWRRAERNGPWLYVAE